MGVYVNEQTLNKREPYSSSEREFAALNDVDVDTKMKDVLFI